MTKRIIFLILWGSILLFSPVLYSQCPQCSTVRPTQSAPFNIRYFQFNLGVSGARANSLGGAFIGVADDATAATTNPAGLTMLTRLETSVHIRPRRTEISELAANRKQWDERKDYSHFQTDLAYGDIVVPFKKLTFAGYWDVVTKAENHFEYQQFSTPEFADPDTLKLHHILQGIGNIPGRKAHYDLQVINIGLAAAYPFSFYAMSLGFSFQVTKLDFYLSETQYYDASLLQNKFDTPTGFENTPQNVYSVRTIDDTDWAVSYTLGLLLKPHARLSVGLVYNRRPELKVLSEIFFPDYFLQNNECYLPATAENETIILKLPDSYGIGLYYRLTDWLRISTDVVRIEYSDISNNKLTDLVQANPDSGIYKIPDGISDLKIDNAIEFHFGVEYLMSFKKLKLALRGGLYTDPFHLAYAINDNTMLKTLFPKKQEDDNLNVDIVGLVWHYSAGCGIGINDVIMDICAKLSTHLVESELIFSLGIRL